MPWDVRDLFSGYALFRLVVVLIGYMTIINLDVLTLKSFIVAKLAWILTFYSENFPFYYINFY